MTSRTSQTAIIKRPRVEENHSECLQYFFFKVFTTQSNKNVVGEKQTHLSSLAGALKIRLMRERSRRNRTGASCTHSGAQRRGHRGDTQHLGSQSIQTETNEHCREAMRQGPGALHLSEWGLGEGKCTVPALSGATSGRLRTTPPFLGAEGKAENFSSCLSLFNCLHLK